MNNRQGIAEADVCASSVAQVRAYDRWLADPWFADWAKSVGIVDGDQDALCTTMFEQARGLSLPQRESLRESILPVRLADLESTLHSYNALAIVRETLDEPASVLIAQNQFVLDGYLSSMLLREQLFAGITESVDTGSPLHKAAQFLSTTDSTLDKIRAAMNKGNWTVDFETPSPRLSLHTSNGHSTTIAERKWSFWRLLARATAWAVIAGFNRPVDSLFGPSIE